MFFEPSDAHLPDIGDHLDTHLDHPCLCDLTNTRDAADWQGEQKVLHFVWLDNEQPIRFFPIRGDLGQKFVTRYAGRRGEVQLLPDLATDRFCNEGCSGHSGLIHSDIEIRLIQ